MKRVTRPKVGALVSAVAAISCNGGQNASQTTTPPKSPTVEVQPAADGSMSAAPPDGSAPADSTTAYEARLAKLRGRTEGREFKKLWRDLDAVVPPAEDAGASGREVYADAIDSSRADGLSKSLDELATTLEQSKLLSGEEVAFFRHAASTRIRNMLQGSMPLMVMHRMPPPYAWQKFASVDQLEQRIDLLVELRKRGKMSTDEYRLALEQVRREAVTLYVVYELGRGGYTMAPAKIEVTDGPRMLVEIEKRAAQAVGDAGPHDRHLKEIVARAKTLVPAIRALITELER